ncbi:N-6 DNA methylase [Mycobacterium sp. SMC-21]|uniref:N-6 DNA methylase n=1 Tax=Mycobacteriaceae TaxID=1762 RepID=UPI001ABF69C2|nr:N-6 DNA methylase [Mycolicibacterium austroafricanum]QRZ10082.1 N-6 DNA methylase [Mycolicibacterium austroafricanum]QZT67340.1 N-6 DNA methylase [Mycolicibacterium austroafricanum]
MPSELVNETVGRLARRKPIRAEAETQADIYMLLTTAGLGLDPDDVVKIESQVADGTRRRIDIEAGHVVIEVKKDLTVGNLADYEQQLAGYVQQRHKELGTRYVGILTDGTGWMLYNLEGDALVFVSELVLNPSAPDVAQLLVWLESVMATREQIKPTPQEIQDRLGADSPGHRLDHASLAALFEANVDDPEVKLKRELWAKLLRTAFGKNFVDDPNLFINHTLLVITAELIAHAAVGWDVSPSGGLSPMQLTSGSEFQQAQIHGVVEADFFDWVVQVKGGQEFVVELGRRIARFDWTKVEHDVLKILYESVIAPTERRRLGEYYTPDWLADRVVEATVTDPLGSRVADPSCGSGTFLFHAIRRYLETAEKSGTPTATAVHEVTANVIGMDVHPVAVTLARVTYVLAIGLNRLRDDDRGPIAIPVYLGDSMQWEQSRDLIGGVDRVTISTEGDSIIAGGGGVLFGDDLVFPRSILGDAGRFDRLVSEMADNALDSTNKRNGTLIDPILKRFKVTAEEAEVLSATFATMRALHKSGKDHIWGYYVRNLIRPLWLAEPDNRVDVLVGNPPWLAYAKMTATMQENYKKLAKPRNLLTGGLGAASRDLSTLFVVRAVELYLRPGGAFSFVMPYGILTRKPHTGFRTGKWMTRNSEHLAVKFGLSWDLARATTGFPMVSCVIHGERSSSATPIDAETVTWTGYLARPDIPWDEAKDKITVGSGTVAAHDAGAVRPESPYKSQFRQGAVLAPQMALFVREAPAGPLGAGAGRVSVSSNRSVYEPERWKQLPAITATVETRFVRPTYLGLTTLPFRTLEPRRTLLAISDDGVLEEAAVVDHPGLKSWWDQAEKAWAENKSESDAGTLLDRIDFHGQLSAQLPPAAVRVVYTKTGNRLAAAVVRDSRAIIDFSLYWTAVATESEASYLCAILNSGTVLERVKPLQALGLYGARHFDKYVFLVPFPEYDNTIDLHLQLAKLGAAAEKLAAEVDVSSARTFQAARKLVDKALKDAGIAAKINAAVAELVPMAAISL